MPHSDLPLLLHDLHSLEANSKVAAQAANNIAHSLLSGTARGRCPRRKGALAKLIRRKGRDNRSGGEDR